ncbi:MAG: GNAT family N-acetyltransferase [Bacteroidia bacterium]
MLSRSFIRTTSANPDFQLLVKDLDADLKIRDGDEHAFYDQFNKIDTIKHAVVAYQNDIAVGCGAFKAFSENTVEIKRMYVPPALRGNGIASEVLRELENWAAEIGVNKCVLETGTKQPEAISLYTKNGYAVIPNFGQYAGVENSVCFEKAIR